MVAMKRVGSWRDSGNQYWIKGFAVLLARFGVKPGARIDSPRGVSIVSLWTVKILTISVASIDEIYRKLHGIGLERIQHPGRHLLHNLDEKRELGQDPIF